MTAHRAIVTGASSGIGLATARLIHACGGSVALIATRESVLNQISSEFGERAWTFPADVADAAAAESAVLAAFAALDDVDLVVNSAGICHPNPLEELSAEKWNRTLGVNLSGVYYVSRTAALQMTHGSIVNVASDLSHMGAAFYADYCASKAGLIGLTKAMAAELAPRRIRVNAVCPGPVDTPMMDAELELSPDPAAARREHIDGVPLGRFAGADEVAAAILFMADAGYVTGSALSLDGGKTAMYT
jgi:3-oxoacyl-[acyl-carrier protein] reductase